MTNKPFTKLILSSQLVTLKASYILSPSTPKNDAHPTSNEQLKNKNKNKNKEQSQSQSPQIMGKVHGSLARAGKVKSQTPKVS